MPPPPPPRFYWFILVSHPLKSPWLFRNPLYWFLLVCTGVPRTEVSTVGAKPPVLVYTGVFPIGRSGLSFPSLWLHWRHREPLWPPVPSPWFSRRRYPAGAAALRVLPSARRRRRPAGCSVSSHPGPARRDGGGGARGGAGRPRRDRGGDGWGRGRRPLGRAPPSRPPRAGARRRRPSPRPSEPQRGPPGAAGAPPGPPRRAPAGGAAAPVPPRVRAALGGGPGQPPRLRRLDRAAGLRRAGEPAGSRAPGVRRLLPALPLLLRLLEEVRGHGAAPGQRPARRGGAGAGSPVHPAEHGFVDPLHLLPAVHAGPGAARDCPAHPRRVRGGRGGGRDGFPLGQALGIVRGVGAGARRPPRRHRHLRPPAVHAHPALQPPLGEVQGARAAEPPPGHPVPRGAALGALQARLRPRGSEGAAAAAGGAGGAPGGGSPPRPGREGPARGSGGSGPGEDPGARDLHEAANLRPERGRSQQALEFRGRDQAAVLPREAAGAGAAAELARVPGLRGGRGVPRAQHRPVRALPHRLRPLRGVLGQVHALPGVPHGAGRPQRFPEGLRLPPAPQTQHPPALGRLRGEARERGGGPAHPALLRGGGAGAGHGAAAPGEPGAPARPRGRGRGAAARGHEGQRGAAPGLLLRRQTGPAGVQGAEEPGQGPEGARGGAGEGPGQRPAPRQPAGDGVRGGRGAERGQHHELLRARPAQPPARRGQARLLPAPRRVPRGLRLQHPQPAQGLR